MEYTIELCVNYNDYGVDFTDYDVEPKVCDKAKYPWENIFEPEEAKQLHGLGIL